MSGRRGRFLFTILLVLIVFSLGTKIVNAEEDPETDIQQDEIQDALLAEFDFNEIEENLDQMFPREKITFSDVVSTLISGDVTEAVRIFLQFVTDQISYEFDYNRRSLVYVLITALTAAVFSNFAGAFRNRQISDISFYVICCLSPCA